MLLFIKITLIVSFLERKNNFKLNKKNHLMIEFRNVINAYKKKIINQWMKYKCKCKKITQWVKSNIYYKNVYKLKKLFGNKYLFMIHWIINLLSKE